MIGISLIDESNFETNKNSVKVGYVVPNSPADKSGILVNDIIIKVGKKDIEQASDVISQISKNGINKKINIALKRRNKVYNLIVKPTIFLIYKINKISIFILFKYFHTFINTSTICYITT